MRWQNFFSEIEQEFEAALAAEARDQHNDEQRLAWAQTTLQARLAHKCASRQQLSIELGGAHLTGAIDACGWDWIAGEFTLEGAMRGRYCVIPTRNIEAMQLACECAAEALPEALNQGGSVTGRIPLSIVLRDLARRRRAVEATMRSGKFVTGTIQRVGKDWFDIATHDPAESLPKANGLNTITLPLRQLDYVTVSER